MVADVRSSFAFSTCRRAAVVVVSNGLVRGGVSNLDVYGNFTPLCDALRQMRKRVEHLRM